MTLPKALASLAQACGLETSYRDTEGRTRQASRGAVEDALRAWGIADVSDPRKALARKLEADCARMMEPVLVAWQGSANWATLTLPAGEDPACHASLRSDTGARSWPLRLGRPRAAPVAGYEERGFRLPAMPLGYHTLRITAGTRQASALVVSAPRKAHPPPRRRAWGLFAPVAAVRSEGPAGTLGDLAKVAAWGKRQGARVVATLPMLAGGDGAAHDPSPYNPVSRCFWDEAYLDLEAIPEAQDPMVAGLLQSLDMARQEGLEQGPWQLAGGIVAMGNGGANMSGVGPAGANMSSVGTGGAGVRTVGAGGASNRSAGGAGIRTVGIGASKTGVGMEGASIARAGNQAGTEATGTATATEAILVGTSGHGSGGSGTDAGGGSGAGVGEGSGGKGGISAPAALLDLGKVRERNAPILAAMLEALDRKGGARAKEFDDYVEQNPQLIGFAAHRAGPGASQADVRRHCFAQWLMEGQLAACAGRLAQTGWGLYLDLPVGSRRGGFDAQRFEGELVAGASMGATPDVFFTKGQDWGFPPPHPEGMRESGYANYRAALAASMRHAGVLRIDHVLGLHRLYWVPSGHAADDGVYVRYRSQEMYAILTLESRRHRTVVVGEDLGTVPPEVRTAMARHGLLRSYVWQFEASPERPLPVPPAGSVASLNTHDAPTFAAWWKGADIEGPRKRGLHTEAQAKRAQKRRAATQQALRKRFAKDPKARDDPLTGLLRWLDTSPAALVLLNMEDLWDEEEQVNDPSDAARPNWRRRHRMSLAAAAKDPKVRGRLAAMPRRSSPMARKASAMPKRSSAMPRRSA